MGYQRASVGGVESAVDAETGGMWFLKDALDTDNLGFTVLELGPGQHGMEHDHAEDGQEEVYFVVEGEAEVSLDDGTVSLEADQALRLDPEETRQLRNPGDSPVRLVLVGAPR